MRWKGCSEDGNIDGRIQPIRRDRVCSTFSSFVEVIGK